MADLDDQRAAGREEARRLPRIVRTASRPSSPPASASCGLVPVFGRQALHRHRGDVGRIADDRVVALLRQVGEQVGADQVDAVREPVVGDVALRDRQRVGRDVHRVDVGRGIGVREQDREAARARAQVERAMPPSRRRRRRARAPSGSSSAMNERGMMHALVDIEAEIAEPGLVRQVGGGDALVDAARRAAARAARARPA